MCVTFYLHVVISYFLLLRVSECLVSFLLGPRGLCSALRFPSCLAFEQGQLWVSSERQVRSMSESGRHAKPGLLDLHVFPQPSPSYTVVPP